MRTLLISTLVLGLSSLAYAAFATNSAPGCACGDDCACGPNCACEKVATAGCPCGEDCGCGASCNCGQ